MGSKLSTRQRKSSKNKYDFESWKQIKSPLARKKFLKENKENIEEFERIKELNKKIKKEAQRIQGIDIENYRTEYNKLDGQLKPFFESPDKVESTTEYQTYISKKRAYETQMAEYTRHIKAWELADKVAWSTNPSAIFALTWSGDVDSKLAQKYYRIINDQKKAYQERKQWIEGLRNDYGMSTAEINALQRDLAKRQAEATRNKMSMGYDDIYEKHIGTKVPTPKTASYEVSPPKIDKPKQVTTKYGREVDYSKYDMDKYTPEEIREAQSNIWWGTTRKDYLLDPKWYDYLYGPFIQAWDWTAGLPAKFVGNVEKEGEKTGKLGYNQAIENWQKNIFQRREELKGITQRDLDIQKFAQQTGKEYQEKVNIGEMKVEEANYESNLKVKEYAEQREKQRIQQMTWGQGLKEKALWLPQHLPSNLGEATDLAVKGYLGVKTIGAGAEAYKYAPAYIKNIGTGLKWGIRGWNTKVLLDPNIEKGDRLLAGTFLAVDTGTEAFRAFNKKAQIEDAILKSTKTANEKKKLVGLLDDLWKNKKFRGEAGHLSKSLDEMGRLSSTEKTGIIKVLTKNKDNVLVGGSLSTKTQLTTTKAGRDITRSDIDTYTTRDTWALTKDIGKELKSSGNIKTIQIKGSLAKNAKEIQKLKDGKSYIVVLQRTKEGKEGIVLGKDGSTLFEVHDYSKFVKNIKEVSNPLAEFFNPSYSQTKEGVKVLSIDAQAKRKLMATLQRNEKKDIKDLIDIISDWRVREQTGNYQSRLFAFGDPMGAIAYNMQSVLPKSRDYIPYSIPAVPQGKGSTYPTIEIKSSYAEPTVKTQYPSYPTQTQYNMPNYPAPTSYPPANIPITVQIARPTITPEGKVQRELIKRGADQEKDVEAYQTLYYTEEGKKIKGRYFPNITEATAEGFEKVDKSPLQKFNIKKVVVKRNLLSRHQGTNRGYKFKSKGDIYIERVPYRKDTKGEKGDFNIMPYVFNKSYS